VRSRGSDIYESIVELIPDDFSNPADSLEEVRAKFDLVHGQDPGPGVELETVEHGIWVRPSDAADDRVAVFAHGGGFVTSCADVYTFWGAAVARQLGIGVLIVDYRLAPETIFPGQLDDLVAAHDAVLDEGHDPARIIFMGDSCGGGMAVATMVRQRDRGRPLPVAFVGFGGWYDLEATGATSPSLDPFVDPDWLRLRGRDYVGPVGDPADPLASPIHADLSGLPSMLLQTGEVDPCLPGARILAERAGSSVTLDVVPAVAQGFQGMPDVVPEVGEAWTTVRRWLDEHVPAERQSSPTGA
jgi:monoterpene epsilon-lactone hydrolase